MSATERPLVVGVDESSGTEAAVRWAAEDAQARSAPVRLVCAYRHEIGNAEAPFFLDGPDVALDEPRQIADRLVTEAIDRVTALYPRAEASGEAIAGDPVRILVDESARAAVVVLGSRHLKALSSGVLGSVSAAVAARAESPAVVVRGPAGRPEEGAAVVVGVDGTESTDLVLEYGFEHASRHHVPLRAVLCWRPDLLASMRWREEPPPPTRAEAWLSASLAGWREKYPDVVVHDTVVRDHPVAGLVTASMAQYLLVVGNRGRHALAGTLLGSVSQGVLHHATCPVAIIPTHGA